MSLWDVNVLLLNSMDEFGTVCVLLFRAFSVFQKVWLLVLWSQLLFMCSFHKEALCCCISVFMSLFSCGSRVSFGSLCLIVLRASMLFLMCSGRSLCVGFIFPFGM